MLKIVSSASPTKVPMTSSPPSLLMMMKLAPIAGTKPESSVVESSALVSVTLPSTSTLSKLALPISMLSVAPGVSSRLPVCSVPGLAPGARKPPFATVTAPTVPVPPSVAPPLTVTALAAAIEPLTSSVPALTVVAPV